MGTSKLMTMAMAGLSFAACTNPDVPTDGNTDPQGAKQKPNIILILLDDLGYSDLGCYGSEMNTPNIDRLAANGIRFRSFYNSARSAPTRGSLMTGLYPHQVGIGSLNPVSGYPNYQAYANEKNIFIPEVLHSAGYFSVMTGKWHIGHTRGVTPIMRGFDRAFYAPGGGYYFSNDTSLKANGQPISKNNLYLNGEVLEFDSPLLPSEWYTTDLWTDKGLELVDEAVDKKQPFFWYLAHNSPHFPLQAPKDAIDRNVGKYAEGHDVIRNRRWEKQKQMGLFSENDELTPRNPNPNNKAWANMTASEKNNADLRMAIYAACIEEVDRNVGKILAYLEEQGILDNTVIMLLSDNGGNAETGFPGTFGGTDKGSGKSNVYLGTPWADVANTPFFLYKHHGHQGGCCTPFIISWPAGIAPSLNGTIDKASVGHITDIMPTVIEMTGATYPSIRDGNVVPEMEGVSLVPSLTGKKVTRKAPLLMEHEGNKMLRDGDWKIVKEYEKKATPWRLYNLGNDPTEMHNLAEEYPDKVLELETKYNSIANRIGVEPSIEFTVGVWYTPVENYFN